MSVPRPALPAPLRWLNRAAALAQRAGVGEVALDPDLACAEARRQAGLTDFGEPSFRPALEQLLASADRDANLHFLGRHHLRDLVVRGLVTRLRLAGRAALADATALRPPLIVCGLPRSGTTFLHRLLALADDARPLLLWELMDPLPGGGPDRRREQTEARIDRLRRLAPSSVDAQHLMRADLPDECGHLLKPTFLSPLYWMVPATGWLRWQAEQDLGWAYRDYRRLLASLADPERRLVLKDPFHAGRLPALFAAIPDAQVVQTHRAPAEVLPSFHKLTLTMHAVFAAEVDTAAVVAANTRWLQTVALRSVDDRAQVPSHRVCDVDYRAILADPVAVVRSIHLRFGLGWSDALAARLAAFVRANPQRKHGDNPYAAEAFGQAPAAIELGFAAYRDRFLEGRMSARSWYDTVSPSEHMDSERSSVYARASSEVRRWPGATVDARTLPGPNAGWPAVTRGRDELFVLHGSLALKGFDGAQLSRIDVPSWSTTWTTRLLDTRRTGDWSYPGAVGVHADGFLYVLWSYHAARIDPATGEVLARVVLPTGQEPKDVTYNGFVVLPDGNLAAKSMYRMPGCKENGFRALSRGGLVDTPSDLVVLDPERMRVLASVKAPEHLLGRITASEHRGRTCVYAAGKDSVFRYLWADGALTLDPTWGPVRTRQDGETPASAITAADGWIFLQGNAGPAKVPFTIHAISQDDARHVHRVQPFPGHRASFNASKLTVDGENRRMYTTDGLIGKLAAYDFDPDRGFTRRWVVDQGSYSFLVLVGPKDERVLVATELLDTWTSWFVRTQLSRRVPWLAYRVAKERVVWRHPDTGAVLARSPELPGGLAIVPGFDGAMFYATIQHGIVELRPRPAQP